MGKGAGRVLTILFRGEDEDDEGKTQDQPCPEGFAGPPAPRTQAGATPEPGETDPATPPDPCLRISLHPAGGQGGTGQETSPEDERRRQVELTISFSKHDQEQEQCAQWASLLCWRPWPISYLNLLVTDVIYLGQYLHTESLPLLTGSYHQGDNTISLDPIDDPEGEPGAKVNPWVHVMWPTGDLHKYLKIESHNEPWYDIEYHLRRAAPEGAELPPLWITGPHIPGDTETPMHDPIYAWRIPVKFTLAVGFANPGPTSGAEGLWLYEDLRSPEKAFQPKSNDTGWLSVADNPKPGEEPQSPGIDFNQEGLNRMLAQNVGGWPLQDGDYTLLMEVLPAYGKFMLKAKYFCQEVQNLQGEYSHHRDQSLFLQGPLMKKPVAYLRLEKGNWLVIQFSHYFDYYERGFYTVSLNGNELGNTRALSDRAGHTYLYFAEEGLPYTLPDPKPLGGGPAVLIANYSFSSNLVNRTGDRMNHLTLVRKEGYTPSGCACTIMEMDRLGNEYDHEGSDTYAETYSLDFQVYA